MFKRRLKHWCIKWLFVRNWICYFYCRLTKRFVLAHHSDYPVKDKWITLYDKVKFPKLKDKMKVWQETEDPIDWSGGSSC